MNAYRRRVYRAAAGSVLVLIVVGLVAQPIVAYAAQIAVAVLALFATYVGAVDADAAGRRHALDVAALARLRAWNDARAVQIVDLEGEVADLRRSLRLVDGAGIFRAVAEDMPKPIIRREPDDNFAAFLDAVDDQPLGIRTLSVLVVEIAVSPVEFQSAGLFRPAIRRSFRVRSPYSTDPDRDDWDAMRASRMAHAVLAGVLAQIRDAGLRRQAHAGRVLADTQGGNP